MRRLILFFIITFFSVVLLAFFIHLHADAIQISSSLEVIWRRIVGLKSRPVANEYCWFDKNRITLGSHINTIRYNTVFGYNTDNCWTPDGHFELFLLHVYIYTFNFRYNTDWIANTKIGLDLNNSVITRFLYIWMNIFFGSDVRVMFYF